MSAVDLIYGIVLAAYLLTLLYVTAYCLVQLHLLVAYVRRAPKAPVVLPQNLPRVTVQLPLYNELYVAQRVIDTVCAFDYPRRLLQIQVLDDSTDGTADIVAERVAHYRDFGFDIEHVRRARRRGFKAGALADAMPRVTGEFIAIFDADFVPAPDFLRRSVGHFADPGVGVVQSRWDHLNENYSVITRLQALQLNVHFTVEQSGRRAADLFAQFNGTAGVWRRSCIDDAGGWLADTLTEDLDLSMRAQLGGWKIQYLQGNLAPAELPAEMNAFKSQQHRWMKGGAETARKILPLLWRSPRLSFGKKFSVTTHLLASSIFLFVFLIGVLSVPTAFAVAHFGLPAWAFTGFLIATLAVGAVYYVGNVRASWPELTSAQATLRFLGLFPLFLSLSMGLSLHNSLAVIQGYRGKRTPFVRTPKFDLEHGGKLASNAYRNRKLEWTTVAEGLLCLVFAAALIWGLVTGNSFFAIFHAMLALGYGTIFYYTLRHRSLRAGGGQVSARSVPVEPKVSARPCQEIAAVATNPV